MAKYGSASALILLVGGFDLRGVSTEMSPIEKNGKTEESTVLGDSWKGNLATGIREAGFTQNGFYDDAAASVNESMLSDATPVDSGALMATSRVGCVGISGNAAGANFIGFEGTFGGKYTRITRRGELTKARCEYAVSGKLDEGVVLQPLATKTADWNTEGADSQDAGASSANGGAGYLQVTAQDALITGFVGKIRHSADDVTYADLVTFTNVTAAPAAERIEVAGVVNRHLAFDGDVTGTGNITVFAGFARNP